MAATFEEAIEARRLAEELIPEYHPHLVNPEWTEPEDRDGDADPEARRPAPVVLIYLFRDDVPLRNGREIWGTASKVSGREWFYAREWLDGYGLLPDGPDPGIGFRIELSRPVWEKLDATERRALLNHELLHCQARRWAEKGFPMLQLEIRAHDLEAFEDEFRWHGDWRRDLRSFADLVRRSAPQLALPLEADPIREQVEAGVAAFLHAEGIADGWEVRLVPAKPRPTLTVVHHGREADAHTREGRDLLRAAVVDVIRDAHGNAHAGRAAEILESGAVAVGDR